jgi:hypothetical protein
MYTVNPFLISLAQQRFEKSAVVPGQDPAAMGGAPPVDPAAMGAVPPVDPAAMGAMGGMPPSDPGSAMAAMAGQMPAPSAPPAPAPTAQPQGQKLKPEQMMQMLDYRLYNMQQQLTAIMNAMGVQVAPESLVLPPGTTGAPPAETALPGGPMAPPPAQDPNAAQGGAPSGPLPPGGPMPPDAAMQDPTKAAWWMPEIRKAAQVDLQTKAVALSALRRSLGNHAG